MSEAVYDIFDLTAPPGFPEDDIHWVPLGQENMFQITETQKRGKLPEFIRSPQARIEREDGTIYYGHFYHVQ